MSHWQTGKLDLKCSLNILKKALINIMPEWEKDIISSENQDLDIKFHGKSVVQKFQLVVSRGKGHYISDIGFYKDANGNWKCGGDYNFSKLQGKLVGEVMRMRAIAIAKTRGYEILRDEENEEECVTEIRINSDAVKYLV